MTTVDLLAERFENDTQSFIDTIGSVLNKIDTGAPSYTVQYLTRTRRGQIAHNQTFCDGTLTSWELGWLPQAHLVLTQDTNTLVRMICRLEFASDHVAQMQILEPFEMRMCRVPPLDEFGCDGFEEMPQVPFASMSLVIRLHDTFFGSVEYVLRFEEGRVAEQALTNGAKGDVTIEVDYETYLRYRLKEIDISGALIVAKLEGRLPHMLLAAGFIDGPEYLHAVNQCGCRDGLRDLLGLSETLTAPAYVDAVSSVVLAG